MRARAKQTFSTGVSRASAEFAAQRSIAPDSGSSFRPCKSARPSHLPPFVPIMSKKSYPCRHTCGCSYAPSKNSDRVKHEPTSHPLCHEGCPLHNNLRVSPFQVLTPALMAESSSRRPAASNHKKRPRALSGTPPNPSSSSSTPKRSRPASADSDLAQDSNLTPSNRKDLIKGLKLCCVLDPSRSAQSYDSVLDHVSWVDLAPPGGDAEIVRLLACPGLAGFVLPHPSLPTVRMYDWVSLFFFSPRPTPC